MTSPTPIPKWGRVVARPNEFLVHIRDGRVRRSGHGISCFKWPGDSVAILPTSIEKLSFTADQVTLEKAGVEVRGLAVYRLVDPMLAHRMIDPVRGSLGEILREMFIGATRRIVASLTLEECITHRKERVAAALMREIAPVLSGEGSAEDATATGWGVVLDTIEIQDVRVLSAEVFARLQAPYREQLAQAALVARDRVLREEARLEAERKRAAEQAARELMAEQDARLEAERRRAIQRREHEDALARRAQEAELARLHERAEAERARAEIELATRREAGELEAELVRLGRVARGDLSEARLREILLTETLPAVANALRGSFERIELQTTDASLGAVLAAGIQQLIELARGRAPLPAASSHDDAREG